MSKIQCPYCHNDFEIRDVVMHNMDAYRKPVTVACGCCNKPVQLTPCVSVTISARKTANNGNDTDSWGYAVTKPTVEDLRAP